MKIYRVVSYCSCRFVLLILCSALALAQDETNLDSPKVAPSISKVERSDQPAVKPMPNITGIWSETGKTTPLVLAIDRPIPGAECDFVMSERDSVGPPKPLRWAADKQKFEIHRNQRSRMVTHLRLLPDETTIVIESVYDDSYVDGLSEELFEQLAKGLGMPTATRNEIASRVHERRLTRTEGPFVTKEREGDGFLVVETKDGLSAYSQSLGKWDRVVVGLPKNAFSRLERTIVSNGFASVVVDDQLLGYSKDTGRWGRLKIPQEFIGKVSVRHGTVLAAKVGDQTYVLSQKTGEWIAPEGTMVLPGETPAGPLAQERIVPETPHMAVFTLKRHVAALVVRRLEEVFRSDATAPLIEADRSNQRIIFRGSDDQFRRLQRLLEKIVDPNADDPTDSRSEEKLRLGIDTTESRRLSDEIASNELRIGALVEQIQSILTVQKKGESDSPKVVELRQRLNEALVAAFDLKSQLEQLRARELQARLARLEQQIGDRREKRQQIIERRARELIEGESTRWNDEQPQNWSAEVSPPAVGIAEPDSSVSLPNPPSRIRVPKEETQVLFTYRDENDKYARRNIKVEQNQLLHTLPTQLKFHRDVTSIKTYSLRLVGDGEPEPFLFDVTLGIYPSQPDTTKFLRLLSIPVRLTNKTVKEILTKNSATQIFYVPKADGGSGASATFMSMWFAGDTTIKAPVEQSLKHGTVVAVLHYKRFSEALDSQSKVDDGIVRKSVVVGSDSKSPFGKVVKDIGPSVVGIQFTKNVDGKAVNEMIGTGVIMVNPKDKRLFVVTSSHLFSPKTETQAISIQFKLRDGQDVYARDTHPQEILMDAESGIAVMKLFKDAATDLKPAMWGDSSTVEVGDQVMVAEALIGHRFRFGFANVSASGLRRLSLGRTNLVNQDFIQTSPQALLRNSGGPLVDLNGHVIGINVEIPPAPNSPSGITTDLRLIPPHVKLYQTQNPDADSGKSAGNRNSTNGIEGTVLNISSNLARRITDQLLEFGRVRRAWIGVKLDEDFGDVTVERLKLDRSCGARVTEVFPNSPAARAGLRVDDVILRFDGTDVQDHDQLINFVSLSDIGRTIEMTIWRDQKEMALSIILADRSEIQNRNDGPSNRYDASNEPESTKASDASKEAGESTPKSGNQSPLPSSGAYQPSYKELATSFVEARSEITEATSEFARQTALRESNVTTNQEWGKARRRLELAQSKFQILKDDYLALLADVELQLKSAEKESLAARKSIELLEGMARAGEANLSTLMESRLKLEVVVNAAERIKMRLELYKKAGQALVDQTKGESFRSSGESPATNERFAPADGWSQIPIKVDSLGLELIPLPELERHFLGKTKYRGGMRVLNVIPGSPAATASIQKDDILAGLDKWETTSRKDLMWILNEIWKDKPIDSATTEIKFLVVRNQETKTGALSIKRPSKDDPGQLPAEPAGTLEE